MQTVPLGQTGMSDRDYAASMAGFAAVGSKISDFAEAAAEKLEYWSTGLDAIPAGTAVGGGFKMSASALKGMVAVGRLAKAGKVLEKLPDSALVCRGGSCKADNFAKGSGVTLDSSGKLKGVSVNSAPGQSVEQLTTGMPHNKVGVTTVGAVRDAGGDVVPSPTGPGSTHCTMCGVTPQKAEELFNPTQKNPNTK